MSLILCGLKDVENRNFSMQGRWFALHLGKSAAIKEVRDQFRQIMGDASTAEYKPGHIHGLIYVNQAIPLHEYRESVGCDAQCKFGNESVSHVPGCKASPFVIGPVLNLILKRIRLNTPVPTSGQLGKWALPVEVRKCILKQLEDGQFTMETAQHKLPREAPLQAWGYLKFFFSRISEKIVNCS